MTTNSKENLGGTLSVVAVFELKLSGLTVSRYSMLMPMLLVHEENNKCKVMI